MTQPGALLRLWLVTSLLAAGSSAAQTVPPAPASATPPAPQLTAIDVFEAAASAALAGRTDEALQLYEALSRDPDIDIRSEARFRQGRLLAVQGRTGAAAQIYRRLLEEKPDAARVRMELAALQAQMGDAAGARRQLRLAQAGNLPPEVASQLAAFSRALRSPKRLGGSLEILMAPDTNINRGTQARTLDTVIAPLALSNDARQTAGLGVRLRPAGFAKIALSGRLSLVARGVGFADLYGRGEANDITATLLGGAQWQGDRDQFSLSYGGSKRWYGGTGFADSRSVNAEWLHQTNPTTELSVNLSRNAFRYSRNGLQDGASIDGSIGIEHALSPRTGATLGISLSRQDAIDPSYAFRAGGLFAQGWHDAGRITLFASLTARRLIGDERNFLFTDKRREWFIAGRAGLIMRKLRFHGFSPTGRIGFERNISTVALFDYQRVYAELGLSHTF